MTAEPNIVPEEEQPKMDVLPDSASSNFYWTYSLPVSEGQAPQVYHIQSTFRGILSPAEVAAHVAMVQAACTIVTGVGGVAKAVGAGSSTSYASPAQVPTREPNSQKMEAQAEAVGLAEGEDDVFDVDEVRVEDRNGKKFYKVAGGRWKKYGVTVWDEVLEAAGVKTAQLEGGKTYKMAGWRAFVENTPEGKPHKVVRLEKKG